jgi:hypothetical protein
MDAGGASEGKGEGSSRGFVGPVKSSMGYALPYIFPLCQTKPYHWPIPCAFFTFSLGGVRDCSINFTMEQLYKNWSLWNISLGALITLFFFLEQRVWS